ncbi:hypothetical protein BGZ83_005139 [Gryganskiella cystojenkinii]|nr:hypothetical protein BGZ83_005139 [Gryganskiella cystojenkinii]
MRSPLLFSFILACFALLGMVAAQSQCGPDAGSCTDGNCCSQAGFCGATPLHCGSGCQPSYGTCGGGGSVSPSVSATSGSVSVSPTFSPTLSVSASTTTTTETSTTRTRHTQDPSPEPTKPTFQLQPSGKPSAAISAQDKGVRSTVALIVVFIAGLMMA